MDTKRTLKSKLTDDVLSKRSLSLKPDSIELYGKYIKIIPLDIERDSSELFLISNGSAIQRFDKYVEEYNSDEKI